jgi:Cu+-exporting ATPase
MPMKDPGYLPTYFDSTTMILSIITLGHRLIDQIKTNADKNYEKAVLEPPKTAHRLSGAESEDIDVDYLDVDDLVLVKTGEMIPVDGNVEEGIGYVDESSLTGESRERLVAPGDTLFGGTLLTSGPLRMKVSKIALDSLYSSIINEAYVLDQRKGRLSRISDRIAGIFTPAILLVSLVSFFIAFYGLGLSAENSVLRAVAVLCVSCPCAFGLAVPISAMSGYDRALRSGILFKTGDTFERIRKVKAIVFDKTGTLSTGHPVLTGRAGEDSYLPLVKAMEKASLHPLAKALLESLRNVEEKEITGVQEIPGVGVSYGNYVLGNLTTAEGKEKKEAIVRFLAENASSSLVLLSDEKEVLLAFAFTDALEGSAEDTVRKLREAGIQSYMLTGDRKEDAEKIAAEAGIPPEHVYSEASPKDKARILREIREKEGVIGYVGDGINDTLALKESDLSFASYQACSIAASSADALLLKPDLHTILYALKVSEKTYRNIVENFLWAIVYNASMIPLAILGILSPSLGALLMIVSNLTLTLNSLRIRLYRPEKEKQK